MECVILGAGGMMPMPSRMTTSVLVRREGRMLMFDAGEGIQISLKKGGLGIRNLDAVAISHLHADHVLGLPGVMMFRAQCEDPGPLTVIGPRGTKRFVEHTLSDLRYRLDYRLEFVEWSADAGEVAWSWHGHPLSWEPLSHSAFCLGYRLDEQTRPGRFDPERAAELGVPSGPLFGRLQAGEEISLPDGSTVRPDQVLGPPRRGRSVVFATDTVPCPGLDRLCRDADLAFVEGMFTNAHRSEAADKLHMTAEQAGRAAAGAGVDRLVLVHISPRYTRDDEQTLRDEARRHHPTAEVGRGLQSYEIKLPN
jgi:ribonuclease Z